MTRLKMPISLSDVRLSRRSTLSGGVALALTAAFGASPAAALSEGQAKDLIDRLVAEVNAIIDSGASEATMLRRFEELFTRYADTNFMARYALGADGRAASETEIQAFADSFSTYISRKYGRRFREFIGGRLEVGSATRRKSVLEVKATAFLRDEPPFEVTFQLSDRTGSEKFVNMFIEGVNLLLSERTEIGAMLDQRGGSIARLTRDLRSI